MSFVIVDEFHRHDDETSDRLMAAIHRNRVRWWQVRRRWRRRHARIIVVTTAGDDR